MAFEQGDPDSVEREILESQEHLNQDALDEARRRLVSIRSAMAYQRLQTALELEDPDNLERELVTRWFSHKFVPSECRR